MILAQSAFAFDPSALMPIPDGQDSRNAMQSALDSVSIGKFAGEGLAPIGIPETTSKMSLSTQSILEKTVQDASKKSLGRLVQSHFEDAAKKVLANQHEKEEFKLARVIVSRLVQDVKDSISVSSNDSEASAQFYANFYMEGFKMALNYANKYEYKTGHCMPRLNHKEDHCVVEVKPQSTAALAKAYASFLINQSSAFGISQSAKSVLVVKALNYFGWDYLSAIENFPDYSNPYNDKVIFAKEVQDGDDHAEVIDALKRKYEVNPQVLNSLRYDIKDLLNKQ